jgi:hypothetical protein
MNNPMHSAREPVVVLVAVFGISAFSGCTSNSGKMGGTSSAQAQGGNIYVLDYTLK